MTDNVLLAGYTCVLSLYLGKILMRSFFGQVKDVPEPSSSQESKGSPLPGAQILGRLGRREKKKAREKLA